MKSITLEKQSLMSIYHSFETQKRFIGLIAALNKMQGFLEHDELKILTRKDNSIKKRTTITNDDCTPLVICLEFSEEDNTYGD